MVQVIYINLVYNIIQPKYFLFLETYCIEVLEYLNERPNLEDARDALLAMTNIIILVFLWQLSA